MALIRTHTCGELTRKQTGETAILNGWVDTRRDLGGVIFVDLRDRYGKTQVVFSPQDDEQAHKVADQLRSEYVIGVEGEIRERDPENANPNMGTGEIELRVKNLEIYSISDTPPFEIVDEVKTNEDLRLKYRYLDLRRPAMQRNLMLRSAIYQHTRNYFYENQFAEIETPFLMRSTPEGARDYLVPSRMNPGKFYALPQSPQTYKQILMVSGMDRYFQIVKCFRDEDLRADRQPEFTQIDVEMSFVNEEGIYSMVEGLMKKILKETKGVDVKTPFPRMSYNYAITTYGSDKPDTRFGLSFPRMSYNYAITTYGSDKPDTRFGLEFVDFSDIVKKSEFRVFSQTVADGGAVAGFVLPGKGSLGRGVMDRLTKRAQDETGAGGLIYIKNNEGEIYSSVSKFVSEDITRMMVDASGAAKGDLILILAGPKETVYNQLGDLRLMVAHEYDMIDTSKYNLLWVTDFPLLEFHNEDGRYYAMHHPFTSPREEDVDLLETDPGKVRARAYDLVLNGSEIGGGSIRIHSTELQSRMFEALGISNEEAQQKFGFLLDAFRFGAPPHGGIALGLDRVVMLLTGAKSLREVIAFPKNQRAISLMDNCPDVVDESQLEELHIRLAPNAE